MSPAGSPASSRHSTGVPALGAGRYSPPARGQALALAAVLSAAGMSVFEALKQLLFPDTTLWQSHAATIGFSTLLTVAAANFLWRHFQTQHAERTALDRAAEAHLATLRDKDDRFRRAVLDAPFPIMIHAQNGEVLQVNRAWSALSGYGRDELSTVEAWTRRAFGPEHAAVRAHIEQLYALDVSTEEGEYVIRTASGDLRTWDFSSAPLGALPDGRRLVISTAKDVTDRQRAEEGRREAETRLRRIAAHSPGTVFQFLRRTDNTDAFPFVSAGCREIYGLGPEQIEADADALISLIHPEDRPGFNQSVDDSTRTLAPWLWEGRFVLASGETKWVKAVSRPERLPNGDTLWDGMALDVTEQKQVEELLRQVKEEAERANVAKSEFLSRMSHELRTPLNAILGFGQLLEGSGLDPGQGESVQQILGGGRHLLELIDEVLDLASVESGRLTFSLQPVDLMHAVRGAADLVRPLAMQQEVRVELALAPECADVAVLADPQRLRQILLNLFGNAVKYNRRGGQVEVTCLDCRPVLGGKLRIVVRDTGLGLDDEQRERLFQPFERLGAERGLVQGSGLGLALCKRLVEAMGGQIGVESVPGQGSSFWVEFPQHETGERRAARTGGEAAPAPAPGAASGGAVSPPAGSVGSTAPVQPLGQVETRLLYVEDNLSNLQLVQRLLERRYPGVRLESAERGRRALELIAENAPDVLLLDLHLPDYSGEEILRTVRADPRTARLPVVVLTADATAATISRVLTLGSRACLTKPLDIARFYEVLDAILRPAAPSPDQAV